MTIKLPTYLTKFPISIRKKYHSRLNARTGKMIHYKEEACYDFTTTYGYFNVDKAGNIVFTITLVDLKNKCNYTIKIAKRYILDSLMLNLLFRPINKESGYKMWTHKNIEGLLPIDINLTPDQIKEKFYSVKEGLEDHIKSTTDKNRLRKAELQLERLINQQWKLELLYELDNTKNILDK